MKRALESLIFVICAIAIHIAFFMQAPRSGSSAGGNDGEALVSIEAAAQTVVDMVKTWERPPTTPTVHEIKLQAPETPMAPHVELDLAPRAEVRLTMVAPNLSGNPVVDLATPSFPGVVAEPKVKPKPRPKVSTPEKVIKAKTNSANRVAQRSAGSGGNTQAGVSTAATALANAGNSAKLKALWGAKIRARIEHYKRYPRGLSVSGKTVVEITVSRNGQLVSYRLHLSSGNENVDRAALDAITRAKKFPNAPNKLAGTTFRFRVPMTFGPS